MFSSFYCLPGLFISFSSFLVCLVSSYLKTFSNNHLPLPCSFQLPLPFCKFPFLVTSQSNTMLCSIQLYVVIFSIYSWGISINTNECMKHSPPTVHLLALGHFLVWDSGRRRRRRRRCGDGLDGFGQIPLNPLDMSHYSTALYVSLLHNAFSDPY